MNEPPTLEDIFRTSSESEEEMNLAVKSWWEEQGEQAPQLMLEFLMNGAVTKRWSKTPKLAYQVFITTSKRARKIDQLPLLHDGKILSKWERTMTYLVRSIVFKRKGVESEEITLKELNKCVDSINDWEITYRDWGKKVDVTGEWKKLVTTAIKQLEEQQQQILRKAAKEAKKKQAEGIVSSSNGLPGGTTTGFLSALMGGDLGGGNGIGSESGRLQASGEEMNAYGSFDGRYGPSPSSSYGFPNMSSPFLPMNNNNMAAAASSSSSSQQPHHALAASGMSSSERRSAEWVGSPPPTRTTSPYVNSDMKSYASSVLLTQICKAMGSPSGEPTLTHKFLSTPTRLQYTHTHTPSIHPYNTPLNTPTHPFNTPPITTSLQYISSPNKHSFHTPVYGLLCWYYMDVFIAIRGLCRSEWVVLIWIGPISMNGYTWIPPTRRRACPNGLIRAVTSSATLPSPGHPL